jgi:S-formylglutathione hydrolase FrmB
MDNRKGTWTTEIVAGHPCELFEAAERNPNDYVVLYLHGVHQASLRQQQPFIEQFERHGLCVVAPQTRRSWWVDRICAEFDSTMSAQQHVLQNVLPFIRERFGAEPPRIALLGTSMGGQGALRLSYLFPKLFPVVAAISPAIDFQKRVDEAIEGDPLLEMYDDPEAARQDTAILHIHPLNWPRSQFFCCDPADTRWYDSADRLRMKLGSLGVPFECDLETTAGGHGFVYYNYMAPRAIDFLVSALNSERLRVV